MVMATVRMVCRLSFCRRMLLLCLIIGRRRRCNEVLVTRYLPFYCTVWVAIFSFTLFVSFVLVCRTLSIMYPWLVFWLFRWLMSMSISMPLSLSVFVSCNTCNSNNNNNEWDVAHVFSLVLHHPCQLLSPAINLIYLSCSTTSYVSHHT